jgi:hypothetical protein
MIRTTRRRRAAFLLPALAAVTVSGVAFGQANMVDTPAYRRLEASEPMTPSGVIGTDYSANSPSLAGLTLLATVPSLHAGQVRRGYFIEAACAAGLVVAFDDGVDTGTNCTPGICTAKPIDGGGIDGMQGGAVTWSAMPHTGRIRIYSTDANCQMAARAW